MVKKIDVTPWTHTPDGLTLRIKATPRSSRNAIKGIIALPDGPALAITITAPPADGAANSAIIATLAKALGISKSAVVIVSGPASRIKRVAVKGDGAVLEAELTKHTKTP